jgi:glycosyltransferase involved in cell wall biosynthesis
MKRRTRVLSLIPEVGFGGAENRVLALALNIDRAHFEHWVFTINQSDPALEETHAMYRQYIAAGVRVDDLGERRGSPDGGRYAKVRKLWRSVHKLARIIQEFDIDVVDAHLALGSLVGVLAASITGTPRVTTLYHTRFWHNAPGLKQLIWNTTDALITDSEVRGREMRDSALFRKPRVVIVPNGVAPPRPALARAEIRRALRIPEERRVIGQVAALHESKGPRVLLEAARAVLQREPDAYFFLVGYPKHDPDYPSVLERKAAELCIGDRVTIKSYEGPIGDVWSIIDIHVHASLFDSLPNAIIEGMSLGKPAVVTAVGGVPDAVSHERTGLVVPPGDARALTAALLRVLRDPRYAARLGAAAFARYQHEYRPELMARRLEACFLDAIRSRPPRERAWTTSTAARFS